MNIISGNNLLIAYVDRGFIFALLNEFDLADSDFTQALKLNPNSIEPRFYRGVKSSQNGEFLKAIEDFNLLSKVENQTSTHFYDPADILFYRGLSKLMLREKNNEAYRDLNEAVKTSKKKSKLYQKVINLLNIREISRGDIRVYYDRWELPEYSAYINKDKEQIRSMYLYRAVGSERFMILWEIRF